MNDLTTQLEKLVRLQAEYEFDQATADPAFGGDIHLEMRCDKALRAVARVLLERATYAQHWPGCSAGMPDVPGLQPYRCKCGLDENTARLVAVIE